MAVKVTFVDALLASITNLDLVEQYDRLFGASLSKIAKRTPVEQMIDDATGYEDAQMAGFVAFVYDVVWCRLPPEVIDASENSFEVTASIIANPKVHAALQRLRAPAAETKPYPSPLKQHPPHELRDGAEPGSAGPLQ